METPQQVKLDRRSFLKLAGMMIVSAGVGLVEGCASPATPLPATQVPTAAATKAAAAPTAVPTVVSSSKGGTLIWGRAFKSTSTDPHKIYGLQEMTMNRHVFDPLVSLDPDGKLVPVLAETWKASDDGRTWTFNLRKGVKFNDGTPFTAEAVKKAIERCKGNTKSGFAFIFANCEDTPTRIVDDFTIELKTKAADGAMPYNLVPFYIPSPDAASNTDFSWDKRVGTGPFKLVEYDIDKAYRFEANGNYWRSGYPKLQGFTWRPITEQSTLVAAVKAGELDLVDGLSPANFLSLRGNSAWDTLSLPSWRLDFYIINQAGAVAALKDAKVRQAMSYAIDRELISKEMMQGFADPWATYPPKGILGMSTKIPANPFDIKKAQELIKASAFASGFEFTFKIPSGVSTHGLEKGVAEFVVQSWNQIGIKAKIETGEAAAVVANYREGKYDAGYLSSVALTGDPDRYFRERLIADAYAMGYKNAAVTQQLNDAVAVTDTQKRQQIYEDVQQKVWEDMPIIYIQQTRLLVAKKKNVTGFVGMPNQMFHLTEVGLA